MTFLLFLAVLFTFSLAKSIIPQPQQFQILQDQQYPGMKILLEDSHMVVWSFSKKIDPFRARVFFFFSFFFWVQNNGLRQIEGNLDKIILFQYKNQKKVMSQILSYASKIILIFLYNVKSCSYTASITTSCSSTKYTRDQISLAFGDAYGNQVLLNSLYTLHTLV